MESHGLYFNSVCPSEQTSYHLEIQASCFWCPEHICGDIAALKLQIHIWHMYFTNPYLFFFSLWITYCICLTHECITLLVLCNYYGTHSDTWVSSWETAFTLLREPAKRTNQMTIIRIANKWISLQTQPIRGYRYKISTAGHWDFS